MIHNYSVDIDADSLAVGHVLPGSTVGCPGIRQELHTPGLCWECRQGSHSPGFLEILETIRWELGLTVPGGSRA